MKKPLSARQIERRLLTRLFEENRPWLYRMLSSRIGDPESANDLVQDTFLNAQKAARRLNLTAGSRAYLKRIAVNLAGRYKLKGTKTIPSPDIEEQAISADEPEETISVAVTRAIERLPERQQAVAKLRLLDSLTFQQISARLNISIRTAKRRMEEAKTLLKRQLKDRGELP